MTESMTAYYRRVARISTGNNLLDESVYNYLLYGIRPGSFTQALLENDLYRASVTADRWNAENLALIAKAFGNSMPLRAWGTPERVASWMADEDGCRSDYRNWVEEQATMLKLQDQ